MLVSPFLSSTLSLAHINSLGQTMSIEIYNTKTGRKSPLVTLEEGKIKLYVCGITAYDYCHIGHARSALVFDMIVRWLRYRGFEVTFVRNFTDIDEKIIKRAQEQNTTCEELSNRFIAMFHEDMASLDVLPPTIEPKATEHLPEIIALIEDLIKKGLAYQVDADVYYRVTGFTGYGSLSGRNLEDMQAGARISVNEKKEHPMDFALWKGSKPGEPTWESPWGPGRPGWHIECSAMSRKYLGETIDIHGGGQDLRFPHHENEIAQSEAATDKKFVNFWLEGEHLLVAGEKMAKSLGNIYTLEEVIKRDFDPISLRYLFLTAHYRSKLNFTWKSLEAAQNTLENLTEEVLNWDDPKIGCAEFEGNFAQAINNDLDMPKAVSVMWELVKSDYPTSAKHQSILMMDKVLGLSLDKIKPEKLPEGAQELIQKREESRRQGKFEESDELRIKLQKMGVYVEDTPEGPRWKVKSKSK